jgi:hypothetical protein
MPLNDPIGSSAPDVLVRNASDLDKIVNSSEYSVKTRTGANDRTISGINKDASEQIARIGFEQPTAYSTSGQTMLRVTQTVTNGGLVYAPAYGTVFPFITSGAFNAGLWRVISTIELSSIIRAITVSNVDALKSIQPTSGQLVTTAGYVNSFDGGSSTYKYDPESSIADDGGYSIKPTSTNGRFICVETEITAQQFGCVGNGITDDSTRLIAYIGYCNTYKKTFINKLTIKTNNISFPNGILMPSYGFNVDPVYIRGAKVIFKEVSLFSGVGKLYCDDLLFSGVRFITCDGFISDGGITIDGSQETFGTFWNNFGDVSCTNKLIFDCDKGQSINQNNFGTCRVSGGVEVKGINTTGIRECHSNIFASLDTSGASSIHLQNNSNLNQTNTVHQWYADIGGSSVTAKGNWNILGSNVDTGANGSSCGERNHYLFTNTNIARNDGDFFAMQSENVATGGEWDILNSDNRPFCLSSYGPTSAGTIYDTADCPSNIRDQYALSSSSASSGFSIGFNFSSQKTVTCAIWYKGDDFASVYSDGNEYVSPSVFLHSSGWKLARFTLRKVQNYIVMLINEGTATTKNISINSIRATDGKTCILPSKQNKRRRIKGTSGIVSSGSSFTVPVNLSGYYSASGGDLSIVLNCEAVSPSFAGYRVDANLTFTKTRYANTDNVTSIGSVSKSVGQYNTTGKDITITGTASGIQITTASGTGPSIIDYDILLM